MDREDSTNLRLSAVQQVQTREIESILTQSIEGRLGDNLISSTRYTLFTWLPITLGVQFRRLANIYFLVISVLMMIGTYAPAVFRSPVEPMSTISTLILVLMVTSCKEGYDDIQRFEADRVENCSPVTVVSWIEGPDGKRIMTEIVKEQQDITPGDIVKLEGKRRVPCDMVLLYTSNHQEGNTCYVETSNIDGETNLKIKVAPAAITSHLNYLLTATEMVGQESKTRKTFFQPTESLFECKLEVEPPNNSIYTFVGALHMSIGAQWTQLSAIPITSDNLLLRSSVFCNTDWAYGVCVYAGEETKIQMNNSVAPLKMSNIERYANKAIVCVFFAQFCLVTISVASLFSLGYDDFYEKLPYVYPEQVKSSLVATSTYLPFWLEQWFVFLILFNNFIPISLYVTMELCTLGQTDLIANDEHMYDATLDKTCVVKTGNLVQELGQISHVFSDKTGTLTRNEMKLVGFTVKDNLAVVVDNGIDGISSDTLDNAVAATDLYNLCRCLVLCHTVVREQEQETEVMIPVEDSGGILSGINAFRRRLSSFDVNTIFQLPGQVFDSVKYTSVQMIEGVSTSMKMIPGGSVAIEGVTRVARLPGQTYDVVTSGVTNMSAALRKRLSSNDSSNSLNSIVMGNANASSPTKPITTTTSATDSYSSPAGGAGDATRQRGGVGMGVRMGLGERKDSQESLSRLSSDGDGRGSDSGSISGAGSSAGGKSGPGSSGAQENYFSLPLAPFRANSCSSSLSSASALLPPVPPQALAELNSDSALQAERKLLQAKAREAKLKAHADEYEREKEQIEFELNRERIMRGELNTPEGCEDIMAGAIGGYLEASLGGDSGAMSGGASSHIRGKKERGYRAESPDELALVLGTKPFGCLFLERSNTVIDVQIMGQGQVSYEQYAVNTFDADRKRMSVVMRHVITGEYFLFCKGADANMLPLLTISNESKTRTEHHLRTYAKKGLRTLVIAQKKLTPEQFQAWLIVYKNASSAMSGRARKLSAAAVEIEQDMELLGITAIEDRLQDQVPTVIADLAKAGVTLWMLTGDKEETAVNIGTSCNLLLDDTQVHNLTGIESADDFALKLEEVYHGITGLDGKATFDPKKSSSFAALNEDGGTCIEGENENKGRGLELVPTQYQTIRLADDVKLSTNKPVGFDSDSDENENENDDADKKRGEEKNMLDKSNSDGLKEGGGISNDRRCGALADSSNIGNGTSTVGTDSILYTQHALVIDGPSLAHFNDSSYAQRCQMLDIGSACRSVIACRLTPIQKAQLVKLVKKYDPSRPEKSRVLTAAIGDGANDVPMIQAADVGIGMFGKEGNQAANQADFAVSQFKHLRRLLLIHGRSSYLSQVDLCLYCLHKNMVLTMTLFWYSYYTSLSGTSLYESWIYSAFNLALGLPIIFYGILDRDLSQEFVLAHPEVYESSRTNSRLSNSNMAQWFVNALCYAGCICTLSYIAFRDTFKSQAIYIMGTIVWTGLVMALQAKVIFMSHSFSWPQVSCMAISVGLMFPYFIMASYGTMAFYKQSFYLFSQPVFWLLGMFTVPAITVILVDGIAYGFKLFFAPTKDMYYKEIELQELFTSTKWTQIQALFCRWNVKKEVIPVMNRQESINNFTAKISSVNLLRQACMSSHSSMNGSGEGNVGSLGLGLPSANAAVIGSIMSTPSLPASLSQTSFGNISPRNEVLME